MKKNKKRLNSLADTVSPLRLIGNISHAASPERLGPRISGRVIWRADTEDLKVALTFDDGPHERSTPRLLDILEANAVTATFFLVGKKIDKHPSIAQEIVRRGHEVGNHTYNHTSLSLLTTKRIRSEVSRAERSLERLNGNKARFLRPPNGLFSRRVLDTVEEMGYRLVIGDVYPRDSQKPGRARIVRRVLARTRPGSIIILHDGGGTRRADRSQTLGAVEDILPALKERGFRFVSLSGLLV